MNKELKGVGGIQEHQKLAGVFGENEVYLNMLLRGEHASLTELAWFLAPGGLLDTWSKLTPKRRQAFFSWALRKNLRVAEVRLMPLGFKVQITLATPFLQRVLAVELVRTFSRSKNQDPTTAVAELRDGLHFKASFWVDHRFV